MKFNKQQTIAWAVIGSLALSSAALAEEIETILSPVTHEKLIKVLRRRNFDYKKRQQENHYLDTAQMAFRYNGISIRLRVVDSDDLKLTIKDARKYKSSLYSLDTPSTESRPSNETPQEPSPEQKSAEKQNNKEDEYVCNFQTVSVAKLVIKTPSKIFELTEKECETTDKSHNKTSPVTFLNDRLKQKFQLPSATEEGKTQEVTVAPADLLIRASNHEERHNFKVNLLSFETKLRVDATVFSNGMRRYSTELDSDDVPAISLEAVLEEFAKIAKSAGQLVVQSPLAGKMLVTFLVDQQQQNFIDALLNSKDIWPAEKNPKK